MSIPYKDFIHPIDKATTEALRSIPGFDALCKKVTELIDEKSFKICATASLIKLGPNQYPSIYNKLLPICDKLQIEPPELYLASNGDTQVQVFGDTKTFIVINAGLFWTFTEDDIESVLAVACGHILCHHALYNTITEVIETSGQELVTGTITGAIVKTISSTLKYWKKCSTFSADRVAVYYYRSAQPIVEMLAKLAGAAPYVPGEFNLDAFVEQGSNYKELVSQSFFNKILTKFNPLSPEHPLAAYRAASAIEFDKGFNYDEFDEKMKQESIVKITQGTGKQCSFEVTFANAKTAGIQFLASKIRNMMNNDPLQVDIQGVQFSLAPGKNWSNILNSGTYVVILKTHNRRTNYVLHLNDHTRLVVEWNDKEDAITVKEEPIELGDAPKPLTAESDDDKQN